MVTSGGGKISYSPGSKVSQDKTVAVSGWGGKVKTHFGDIWSEWLISVPKIIVSNNAWSSYSWRRIFETLCSLCVWCKFVILAPADFTSYPITGCCHCHAWCGCQNYCNVHLCWKFHDDCCNHFSKCCKQTNIMTDTGDRKTTPHQLLPSNVK